MKRQLYIAVAVLLFSAAVSAFAQSGSLSDDSSPDDSRLFGMLPGERMTMTTRSSVRIHLNDRYMGFRYGEERILLNESDYAFPGQVPPGTSYEGTAFVLSNTVRDQRMASRPLDEVVPVQLHIGYDGSFHIAGNQPVVAVRSIPSFPDRELSPGDTWEAYGKVVVDPFQDGVPTTVPVYIGYEFVGYDNYMGEPAAVINAQYALRYRSGQDRHGDPELQTIQGRHRLNIFMSTDGSRPLFIRDTLEDQFLYHDGTRVTMSGFRLTFFDTPRPRSRPNLRGLIAQHVPDDDETEKLAPEDRITIDETDIGVRLSLPALRFVADQAILLPEENRRLATLFRTLQDIRSDNPELTFLVVGHTADVGLPENQQRLSKERAKTVVNELVSRGLPADRFLYQGRGGSEPTADNSTAEGRALNRRVEIFIID